jgi:hypothetical protein
LQTAQCVMHLLYPLTVDFRFQLQEADGTQDEDIFRYFLWKSDSHEPGETNPRTLLVAVQPPWIASLQDLDSFVNLGRFPSHARTSAPLVGKERMWAKVSSCMTCMTVILFFTIQLWDACLRNQCRWFVLTTYDGWVFGSFSPRKGSFGLVAEPVSMTIIGWTRAFAAPVYHNMNYNPTVIEMLVYWLASSHCFAGRFITPNVCFPCDINIRSDSISLTPYHVDPRGD